MASFVDVPDIGSDFLVLMACEHRLSSGDIVSCLHQIERLARESPYDGVRASANEMLRRHRESQTAKNKQETKTRPETTSAELE